MQFVYNKLAFSGSANLYRFPLILIAIALCTQLSVTDSAGRSVVRCVKNLVLRENSFVSMAERIIECSSNTTNSCCVTDLILSKQRLTPSEKREFCGKGPDHSPLSLSEQGIIGSKKMKKNFWMLGLKDFLGELSQEANRQFFVFHISYLAVSSVFGQPVDQQA